jgi:hypothetical protein
MGFGDSSTSRFEIRLRMFMPQPAIMIFRPLLPQADAKTLTVPGVSTGTPPTVSFTVNPLNTCASEIISFNGQAVTTGGRYYLAMGFGDGNTSDLQVIGFKISVL